MAMVAGAYTATSYLLSRLLSRFPLKIVLIVGLILSFTSFFLMGPCRWLPRVLPVVLLGIVCVSIGVAIDYIVAMPNLVEVATEELSLPCDDALTDSLSSIVSTFLALGEVVGPLLAGGLISSLGFELAGVAMGCVGIGVLGLYLLVDKFA